MPGTHRTCEVCGIKERHGREKRFFANFPLDKNRCKEWVKVVGKEDLAYLPIYKLSTLKHICEAHFSKRDFSKTKKRLKKRAVPKCNLSMGPLSDDILAEFMRINSDENINPNIDHNYCRKRVHCDHSYSKLSETLTATENPRAQSAIQIAPADLPPVTTSTSQTGLLRATASTSQASLPPAIAGTSQAGLPPATAPTNQVGLPPTTASTSQADLPLATVSTIQISHGPEKTLTSEAVVSNPSPKKGTKRKFDDIEDKALTSEAFVSNQSQKKGTKRKLDDIEDKALTSEAVVSNQSQKKGIKRKLDDIEDKDVTPRKKKLLKQLRKTKCTLASLKRSAKLIENLSSPILKEFVLSALKNQKRKPQGKRWTTKNKISALAIFKRSPKAYRYLQHIMPLPSVKTLQNILKKVPMEPGVNRAVINHLKKVASNFKVKDKLCSLAFDEIALKERLTYNVATDKVEGYVDFGNERKCELANHALVFMLQGLGKKIKQPLAFYFVKGTVSSQKLATIIKQLIEEVNSTGFNVLATVCDQGPTNMGALKLLKEWYKGGDNYFEVNNKKIYTVYDVPHLLKSVRNNFMKQGFIKMEGRTGQWSHIVEVEEQNRNFLYLSKITPTHIQPKYRAKMRVKYAAQILSQTVAAVLKLLARSFENQDTSEQILQTALVVEDLNKLFDYTNGPASADDVKKGIRENVSAKTDHVSVWAEYRKKLSTLKFVNKNGEEAKNVKCIEGYIMTLKSLRDIWSELQDVGFKYFNLRQINQDALENLFGLIRQHGQTNKHPTCSLFIAALKTSIISGMTAPHSKSANCEKDYQKLLTDFHNLVFEKEYEESSYQEKDININEKEISMEETDQDNPILSIPEEEDEEEIGASLAHIKEQPLVYVSGYIASVVLKKNDCANCKRIMTVEDPEQNPIYDFIKLKEWWQNKQSLTYPSVQLCQIIEKGIASFQKEVIPNFHVLNICQWTITIFYSICNTSWLCSDHVQEISNLLFTKLALLLIRRQYQIVNLTKAIKEEDLADSYKKGQQYGIAK